MSRQDAALWMSDAPTGLVDLLRRMTYHRRVRWEVEDYTDPNDAFPTGNDGRIETEDLEDAEAVGSRLEPEVDLFSLLLDGRSLAEATDNTHCLAIDIDIPAWLVPSSTEGHSHLYVDLRVTDEALWRFLEAAVEIGLVEEGYVNACKARGMTSLRAPWIVKGSEVPLAGQGEALPAS